MSHSFNITGVVITYNEERNIQRCLKSLEQVCDELIVVDSYSTDKTVQIAGSFDVKLYENKWPGFKEQKNFGQEKATFEYVLQLDADEELSDELIDSILRAKSSQRPADGYRFNRFTNFSGKWIKHSGWYPDAKLRLYKKEFGKWTGLEPHPFVGLEKGRRIEHLKGDLLHYSFKTPNELIEKSIKYAHQAAMAMFTQGKNASLMKILFSPLHRFVKDYFFKGGFRDGFEGFLICRTAAFYTFLKYMYLKHFYKDSDEG